MCRCASLPWLTGIWAFLNINTLIGLGLAGQRSRCSFSRACFRRGEENRENENQQKSQVTKRRTEAQRTRPCLHPPRLDRPRWKFKLVQNLFQQKTIDGSSWTLEISHFLKASPVQLPNATRWKYHLSFRETFPELFPTKKTVSFRDSNIVVNRFIQNGRFYINTTWKLNSQARKYISPWMPICTL